MLSVVTPEEMRQKEQSAITSGTSVETLMEQAGKETAGVVLAYIKEHNLPQKVLIVAGTGNNGGDGYVVARYLLQEGFSVMVCQIGKLDPDSLVKKQRRRYEARGGRVVDGKFVLNNESLIVDALFGTGFHGTQQQESINIINAMNASRLPIIAVDVPSGLNAATGEVVDVAIHATITCTMEYPKRGFFFKDGWNHVGRVISVPIGLKITPSSTLQLLEQKDVAPLLPPIVRSCNKYSRGYVVGLAGSHGMAGASLMSSFAALRSGAGIVHLLHPEEASAEFVGPPLEIVKVSYKANEIDKICDSLNRASGTFIGPGLGNLSALDPILKAVFANCTGKMVIDADALTWLAHTSKGTFGPLPNAILTPHLGEMLRFFPEKEQITPEFIQKCQQFADKNQTNLILKGAPTFLFTPGKTPCISMEGDPAMATAGSGDVLTGILAALLAQGLTPEHAMQLGTYLHGLAGRFAAQKETSYCVTATSLISCLPDAFKTLVNKP
jgi:NAD(P)H-hydrate epimerase